MRFLHPFFWQLVAFSTAILTPVLLFPHSLDRRNGKLVRSRLRHPRSNAASWGFVCLISPSRALTSSRRSDKLLSQMAFYGSYHNNKLNQRRSFSSAYLLFRHTFCARASDLKPLTRALTPPLPSYLVRSHSRRLRACHLVVRRPAVLPDGPDRQAALCVRGVCD